MIKFMPAADGWQGQIPTAIVGADGQWHASFASLGDGAPPGEYRLFVVWFEQPPDGGMPFDRLHGQFCDLSHSVAEITVKAGDNLLAPLELATSAAP